VVSIALLAAFTATAAGASAAAPAAVREPAAATPGWRIVQVFRNAAFDGLTALGARNAWLAGDSCADTMCDRGTMLVRHWDGKAWRVVTPPRAYINSALNVAAGPVVATSASNAWVFADRGTTSFYTDALHWTGTGWAAPVRLNTMVMAAVALSPANVWAFGPDGFLGHYNGKTWSRRSLPVGGTAAAATSASDVWVGGLASGGNPGIEHWNGHAWRVTPLPNLGIPTGGTLDQPYFQGIAAITPRDAWADISVLGEVGTTYLLHWNGKLWTRASFPYAGYANTPVVSDGHGGLWLSIDGGRAPKTFLWFCHFANGHWTRTVVPSYARQQPTVDYLAWIPGTRSVWGTGGAIVSQTGGEAVVKYGP
jgi:hypothetical protein